MSDPNDYPDLEADGLGELKKIRRHPRMQPNAPAIRWGDEYASWPMEKRLRYAERLASTMNHAADVLQKERDELIELAKRQEMQIEQATGRYVHQGEIMHTEMQRASGEMQDLYREIVKLRGQLRAAQKRVKELEHGPLH